MEQRIEPLTPADLADLAAKRDWVRGHYEEPDRHAYETLEGKLRLLDAILEHCWIGPEETLKLQCLGVTFGDALAQRLGLAWMAVEDSQGRDPALIVEGTSIVLFPLTSISKRIERGEQVVIDDLFEGACATIERLRADAADRAGEG